jgi:hypothetical protein
MAFEMDFTSVSFQQQIFLWVFSHLLYSKSHSLHKDHVLLVTAEAALAQSAIVAEPLKLQQS